MTTECHCPACGCIHQPGCTALAVSSTPTTFPLPEGLPKGPWTYDATVMPGHYGVYDATGRTVARTEDEEVARAIASLPTREAKIEEQAQEIERLKAESEQRLKRGAELALNVVGLRAENAELREAGDKARAALANSTEGTE